MKSKQSLDNRNIQYCGQLRNRVVRQRKRGRFGRDIWDYPYVASTCEAHNIRKSNFSRPMKSCNPILLTVISKYGILGKPVSKNKPNYNGTPNYPIGNCAEQHAANDVLNANCKKKKQIKLKDISYSTAMFVRDNRIVAACVNCRLFLPNVK